MSQKPRFSLKDSQVVKSYYRVLRRVTAFFGDPIKAQDWMFTENMMLGGISPLSMIEAGRAKKLEDWIVSQIDENEEPTAIKGFGVK